MEIKNIMKLLKLSLDLYRLPEVNKIIVKQSIIYISFLFYLLHGLLCLRNSYFVAVLSNSSGKRKQMVISVCLFVTCYLFYIFDYVTSS